MNNLLQNLIFTPDVTKIILNFSLITYVLAPIKYVNSRKNYKETAVKKAVPFLHAGLCISVVHTAH
jgi:hypothetical protein